MARIQNKTGKPVTTANTLDPTKSSMLFFFHMARDFKNSDCPIAGRG